MESSTQTRGKDKNVAVLYALPSFQEVPQSAKLGVQESRVGRGLVEGKSFVIGLPRLCPLPIRPKGQVRQLRRKKKIPHCEVSEALLRWENGPLSVALLGARTVFPEGADCWMIICLPRWTKAWPAREETLDSGFCFRIQGLWRTSINKHLFIELLLCAKLDEGHKEALIWKTTDQNLFMQMSLLPGTHISREATTIWGTTPSDLEFSQGGWWMF